MRIKTIEYHENGLVKRVEFYPDDDLGQPAKTQSVPDSLPRKFVSIFNPEWDGEVCAPVITRDAGDGVHG